MAGRTANISSIDAVQGLKLALQQFEADVQDALILLELESRRPVDWIENDRTRYWPREMQKASDAVSEARLAVEQREAAIRPGEGRSSYDARKQLEKAKRRLRLTETKIEAVRKWKLVIRKEVEEFKVQAERLKHFLESDMQRSIATLDRMAESLAAYVAGIGGGGSVPSFTEGSPPNEASGQEPAP